MNKSTKGLSLSVFLEFVEMKTKVASVFPMTLGILWSLYRYQAFNWLNTLLFIIAVLSFDMCTTAINNSMDYHKAKDEAYRQESNVIGKFSLDFRQMIGIVLALLIFLYWFHYSLYGGPVGSSYRWELSVSSLVSSIPLDLFRFRECHWVKFSLE